jgi:uncharacterized protein (TIGR03067 family)
MNVILVPCWIVLLSSMADPRRAEEPSLEGTWLTVAAFNDEGIASSIGEHDPQFFTLTIRDNKLSVQGAKAHFEAVYRVDAKHEPKWIEVTRTVRGKPATFRGIYEVKGDKLRLCLAGPGDERPTAFKHGDGIELALELARQK